MGVAQIPAPAAAGGSSAPSPSFIPCPKVPPGLTLRNTYQASASGLSFPVEWVYAVVVGGGGGGGGGGAGYSGGGGGGACFQGWVKAADLTAVTIGAGGTSNLRGSATVAGPVRAPGGAPGGWPGLLSLGEPGAGSGGGSNTTDNIAFPRPHYGVAHGMFNGGPGGTSENSKLPATSGAGGDQYGGGASGIQGPGGGSGSGSQPGGGSQSPNGSTYTGGATGGGGAGVLGNGTAGNAGGGGVGGGGGGYGSSVGGTGGNGAVLIYY